MFFVLVRLFFVCSIFLALSAAPLKAQETIGNLQAQVALVSEFDVNGLKVLVKRRVNSQTVSVGLFLRGGVHNLTTETAGIENLMLNAAAEASRKYPREALRRELARSGAVLGSASNYDFSVLSLGTPRAEFDRTWELFTDVALNPSFAAQDVDRVRSQMLAGLREQNSDPDSYLSELQEKTIYAGHPYANDPTGTIESISRLKPEDLRRYHKDAMQTSRLLLVVVGDLDAEALKSKISQTIGKLPRGSYQAKPTATLNFATASLDVTPRALPTNYVQGTFAAPSAADPDIYAMRVAITILRDRVFEEVRVRRNLSYAPSASIDNRAANTAGIYVSAVDANQAVTVMLGEIAKLQNNLVDASDITGVVGQYLTTYYLGQETNAAQAADLAINEMIGGGWRNAFKVLDKTREVTPEDVRRVAQKYMKNIRFVVLGNAESINRDVFLKQSA